VLLSLTAPPAGAAAVTLPLVRATFQLVDALDRLALRPETRTKLRKAREDVVARMRDEVDKEAREEVRAPVRLAPVPCSAPGLQIPPCPSLLPRR
jgi:hypothetical protein